MPFSKADKLTGFEQPAGIERHTNQTPLENTIFSQSVNNILLMEFMKWIQL